MTQFIAYQLPEVQEAMAHPTTGVASQCEFLPTIAQLKKFIEDRAKRQNTRATGYKYLRPGEDDPVELPPLERRKQQVIAELGYDPSMPRKPVRPPLEQGIIDAIEEGRWSPADLKTPPRPASAELKALVRNSADAMEDIAEERMGGSRD